MSLYALKDHRRGRYVRSALQGKDGRYRFRWVNYCEHAGLFPDRRAASEFQKEIVRTNGLRLAMLLIVECPEHGA